MGIPGPHSTGRMGITKYSVLCTMVYLHLTNVMIRVQDYRGIVNGHYVGVVSRLGFRLRLESKQEWLGTAYDWVGTGPSRPTHSYATVYCAWCLYCGWLVVTIN